MKIILYTTTELNLIKDIIDNVEKYQVNEVGEIKENLRFVENYKEFTICFNEDKKYYIAVEKNKASNENLAKETSEVNESVYSQDFSEILKLLYKYILNISRRTKISVFIIVILIFSNVLLYNEYFNYDSRGFNKHNIHRVTKTNYDEEGYDINGYNKSGFNKENYDRKGYDKTGYNKAGYDKEGYNKTGYNKSGYDKEGYSKTGFNKNGYDRKGSDIKGFNSVGFNINTNSFYDVQGFKKNGQVDFDFYKDKEADSLEEVYEFASDSDIKKKKDQFETGDEYAIRISKYKNDLLRVFNYTQEYGLSYDINKEEWSVLIESGTISTEIGISGNVTDIFLIESLKFSFPMKKELAKINRNPKLQILYGITPTAKNNYSFSSFMDSNGKPIDFPTSSYHPTILKRTYIKVWAVIIWDESKENVLYYKKI